MCLSSEYGWFFGREPDACITFSRVSAGYAEKSPCGSRARQRTPAYGGRVVEEDSGSITSWVVT